MFNRVSYGSLILLVALFAVPLVSAQENSDLTDEELTLVERVLEARAKLDTYASFVEETAETRSQALTINTEGTSQAFNNEVSTERAQTVIHDEGAKNIAGTVTAAVTEEEPLPNGQPGIVSYTLVAEFRLVDDTMYVNTVYESPDPTLPEIPEGWVVYTIGENETLDALGLDNVLEERDPAEREEQLKSTAKDVTLESATLDDGTPVEVITIIYSKEAFANQVGVGVEGENPFIDALLASISENSTTAMIVTLDMDGNPLRVESIMTLESFDMSGAEIDSSLEGMTLDMVITFNEVQAYSQFDETFEPAIVPEEVVE